MEAAAAKRVEGRMMARGGGFVLLRKSGTQRARVVEYEDKVYLDAVRSKVGGPGMGSPKVSVG